MSNAKSEIKMNFFGTGKRLEQGDIGYAAKQLGVETAVLLAFIEVEAAGRGFDNKNRLKMLRETHIFYRELGPGKQRNQAMVSGLANKSWVRNYKSDSYPDLERMMKINKNAALRSCSWALPQILGNNCNAAGFANAEQMVKTMLQGEREQLLAMVTLMRDWKMVPLLTGRDFTKADSWRAAASKYNGKSYATHNYHGRLAAAYIKHKRGTDTPMRTVPQAGTVLKHGMKGEAVRNLQNDLALLGYKFTKGIDGRFGNETRDIVKAFQAAHKLTYDGVVGPETMRAIAAAVAMSKVDHSPEPPEWDRSGGGLLARIIAAIMAVFKRGS